MDRAEKARKSSIKSLSEPIDLTPERLQEMTAAAAVASCAARRSGAPDRADGHAVPERACARTRAAPSTTRTRTGPKR